MPTTKDGPSHNRYEHFRCEEAVITDVNRKTWTVTVETKFSSKTIPDVDILSPYQHYANGEGIHHLPEVGARCMLAFPSDNSPVFIMGYRGVPGAISTTGAGSGTDVSYQSNRPDMNPGDIGVTGRDGNFFVLRRGGILQLGATGIAQRIYIPLLNYIKDFAENYEMATFGGDLSWTVHRAELDPTGQAPSQWVFHMNEFAADAKASLRIRHMALGPHKTAWEVHVAPQGIDRKTGKVSSATYSMLVAMDGTQTEFIGANRSTTVQGDDALVVQGNRSAKITGSDKTTAESIELVAASTASLVGKRVNLGGKSARHPTLLGDKVVNLLTNMALPVATVGGAMVASPDPAFKALLQTLLSSKVFVDS